MPLLEITKQMKLSYYADKSNPNALGIVITEDLAVNEVWTKEACELLVAQGAMQYYDECTLKTPQEIRDLWEKLWHMVE